MDARATREAKREKRKERTCVWAKYRNGRTVRARKKRESARKIHRWKRGARWCGAGCLQRVDSLAFGVARREGHCQCQGGSRQPSCATANRATFFRRFCYFRRIFVSSFLVVLLLRLVTRYFLIVFHLQTDAAVEDAFSRLFQQRAGTRSLGYLSLSALRRRRGSAASACVCAWKARERT